jgi:sigma-B regulation protein RsbU (phosphoserine phosphatase)
MSAIPKPRVDSELIVQTANGQTSTIRLVEDRYQLGRAPTNQLCYMHETGLSRDHLVFERTPAGWLVRDLGSTNGTSVNGTRLQAPHLLQPQDRINAGSVTLTFQPAQAVTPVDSVEAEGATSGSTTMTDSMEALAEETQIVHTGHMKALIHAGRELATHLPLSELFELILDLSMEAVGATRGLLMTMEKGVLQARASKGAGLRISSHVRDIVISEKRSLLIADALADAALSNRASIVGAQIRSIIAVPLQTDDTVIGLIYLDSPFLVHEFTRADLSLLTVMASMAAVRIENARLAEVEQAERLRAQELEHAAMIQRSMLPSNFPPFPGRSDFHLHAQMEPAREVGGDLFDFFLLDDHRLAFTVGDVSGKGVPAALFMAVCRTLLKATAPHEADPGTCLTFINTALAEQNTSNSMFVTLFYAVLDTHSGEIRFANAGHNPPYLYSSGAPVQPVRAKSGPMLGMFEGFSYETHTMNLAPAQGILVYTDGVTEAVDPNDQFFDESRLEEFLLANSAGTPQQLVSGLQAAVREFAAGAPQADDITVLALQFIGPGAKNITKS